MTLKRFFIKTDKKPVALRTGLEVCSLRSPVAGTGLQGCNPHQGALPGAGVDKSETSERNLRLKSQPL